MLGFDLGLVGFPATRYSRSPSAFSDVSAKPSFLRTTPAKKPRTECCCQPVAFMIAAIVAPLGCLSRARTASCLVPVRVEAEAPLPDLARVFARPVRAAFVALCPFLGFDILGFLSVATASVAVTTEAPQWRHRQRGGNPKCGTRNGHIDWQYSRSVCSRSPVLFYK